jgi:hypothetical protein
MNDGFKKQDDIISVINNLTKYNEIRGNDMVKAAISNLTEIAHDFERGWYSHVGAEIFAQRIGPGNNGLMKFETSGQKYKATIIVAIDNQ